MKIINDLKSILKNKFTLPLFSLGLLLRLFWFYTPLEGDEGLYVYFADLILKGNFIFKNNKTIFLILNNIPVSLFGGHSFAAVRIYGMIVFFITLVLLLLLIYKIEKNSNQALFGGFIYTLLMHIPLFQGFLNKPGLFFNFYFIISLLLLFEYLDSSQPLFFYLSSIMLVIAVLSNSLNLFFIGIFNLLLIWREKNITFVFKYLLSPFLVFVVMLFLAKLIFNMNLAFKMFNDFIGFYRISFTIMNFHNVNFKWLFYESLTLPVFIILISFLSYSRLKNKSKLILVFTSIAILPLILLPSFGHYFVCLFPLLSITGSKAFQIIGKRQFLFIFIIILLFTFTLSIKYYPSLNLPNSVKFHDIETYDNQIEITNFLKENLNKNESFFYWGWTPGGLYWLTDKEFPYTNITTSFIYICSLDKLSSTERQKGIIQDQIDYKYLLVAKIYDTDCALFDYLYGDRYHLNLIKETSDMFIYKINKKNSAS